MSKILEENLSTTDLFAYPTVDSLAKYVMEKKISKPQSESSGLEEIAKKQNTIIGKQKNKEKSFRERRGQALDLNL